VAGTDPLNSGGASEQIKKVIEASKLIIGAGASLAPGFWAKYYPHLNPTIPEEVGFMVLPAMGASGLISYLITLYTPKRTKKRRKAIWPAVAGFIVFIGAFGVIEALHVAGASDPASFFWARILFLATFVGLAIAIGCAMAHFLNLSD
jgi:hypothetical protein